MSLSSVSIRRPVLAIVMSIVIVLFGIIGFTNLGVREYPSVEQPVITVSTNYTGANADIIESQITEPIEEQLNSIAGVKSITSVSRDGRSTITVEFGLEIDMETAANDVRDKVSRAVSRIPPDADPPTVNKADADASPIVFLNIKSNARNLLEMSEIADNTFKERLQTIPGVSGVHIWGEKKYAMRLWFDPDRLAAYKLTPLDVRNAINLENVELPSGRIEGDNVELTVRTLGRLDNTLDFDELVIKREGNNVVRLRDVARTELGPENTRTILKRDGVPMVGVVLIPQPGSNYIDIADEFYKRKAELERDMPADIELEVGFDTTQYIRESISEVKQTIFIAFILVVFIIFFFLRNWRTTLIPVIVIPISLIGSFFIMYISGFSINVLTLLGIVLAIGLVVDDAIVVLENIYKKIEEGMDPKEAGEKGVAEIFFAVLSTTIALAAVFLPVIFLQGLTGRLFREFGIVVAGAVIISSFVALTLTPMLSTRLLKQRKPSKFYMKTEKFFVWMNTGYENALSSFMNARWLVFPIIAGCIGLIYLFIKIIPSELAPLEDRSDLRIIANAPEGVTFDYMDRYMDNLYQLIEDSVPEAHSAITVTSPGFGASSSVNSGFMRMMLVEPDEREISQQDLANKVSGLVRNLSASRAFVTQQQTIGGRGFGGMPVEYVIQAQNMDKLREVIPAFMAEVSQNPTFGYADINLKFNKPEIEVNIDREKARAMGVSTTDIAQTLQLGLSGQRFSYFIMNGKQYQVIGEIDRNQRNTPLNLRSLYVRNNQGQMVQLDNVVTLSDQSNPPQLFRYNRFASATVSASLAPGKTVSHGIAAMDEIAANVLDDTFSTALAGTSRDFAESSSSLLFAFLLALALIYLVLAAQFESFRDPLIIMFTVPLALAGTLLSIWYFEQTMNIFSQIGIIMLIGLVTKNGILIVEFANQRKAAGLTKFEAAKSAAVARFRPILMTSLSTILGILPIALALGAGSESRVSMGIAVIGGLIFASLLTLFIIPAMYSYLSEKDKEISNITVEEEVKDEVLTV